MGELLKTVVIKVLKVLPLICIALLSSTIVMLAVSLNHGVKWNEYTTDVYGIKAYYFSTLHSSVDVAMYKGVKNGQQCTSEYMTILNPHHDDIEKSKCIYVQNQKQDSWKALIRIKLHQAVGLVSGALFFLIVSVITHSFTKQKLFVVISKLCALGTGIAGGYLSMNSTGEYVKGIPGNISLAVSGDYFAKKEEMQIGYTLAKYGAVITLIGCGLIVADIALYIPFGKGKWIWKNKTDVIPDTLEH